MINLNSALKFGMMFGVTALLGIGCGANNVVSRCPPPSYAAPSMDVRTGPAIKNSSTRAQIDRALTKNTDFQKLRNEWIRRSFVFAPVESDYITAIDKNGDALVGLSMHAADEDTHSRISLVAFYPATLNDASAEPRYLYMTDVYFSGPLSNVVTWVESGGVGKCETLISDVLPRGE